MPLAFAVTAGYVIASLMALLRTVSRTMGGDDPAVSRWAAPDETPQLVFHLALRCAAAHVEAFDHLVIAACSSDVIAQALALARSDLRAHPDDAVLEGATFLLEGAVRELGRGTSTVGRRGA